MEWNNSHTRSWLGRTSCADIVPLPSKLSFQYDTCRRGLTSVLRTVSMISLSGELLLDPPFRSSGSPSSFSICVSIRKGPAELMALSTTGVDDLLPRSRSGDFVSLVEDDVARPLALLSLFFGVAALVSLSSSASSTTAKLLLILRRSAVN